MRADVLVTGGSDGSVRVWSLDSFQPIHRLAAHDNSVTSLQFDDTRIVSGGSDGRVKVWDLKKGTLVRELSSPAEAVWRVVFEEEKAVIMASRVGKTVMEVCARPVCPFDMVFWYARTLVLMVFFFLFLHRSGHFRHRKTSTSRVLDQGVQSACRTTPCPNTRRQQRLLQIHRRT